ncbi:MAG: sulfite exporter TauE/SafE family protein [Candidatus Kapabacteria bacterium]|nr:sulfite exporter TauE/SafE family protein [Candidatus Kapabacteria bacterium]
MIRSLRFYAPFAFVVCIAWIVAMIADPSLFQTVVQHWPAALTMVAGSFIGGASAEGGGAVAFPVFTLILNIPPDSARNFSFAIQSVGMVSASLLIAGKGIRIEPRAVIVPSIAAIAGLVLGTHVVVPAIEPVTTKLFFVSLWMAFGVGLWRSNRNTSRSVVPALPARLSPSDLLILLVAGFCGGVVTSIFGNGVDLLTFCVLTLWYRMDERVATPTSVVLMSVLTVTGFFYHRVVLDDFGTIEFNNWLAAMPVVLVFAPLGALVISSWTRHAIARLLYVIMIVQLIGAIYVLGPSPGHLLFSAIVLVVGSAVMVAIDMARQRLSSNPNR